MLHLVKKQKNINNANEQTSKQKEAHLSSVKHSKTNESRRNKATP